MSEELSSAQLSILHVLRDGDDPTEGVSERELHDLRHDLARLVRLAYIEQTGTRYALTIAGLDELSKPGNSRPMSLEDMERYSRKTTR